MIDSHQHFWEYSANRHNWIDDDMSVIRKDFMPHDLLPVYMKNGIDGCVSVQADQTEIETNFLLKLSGNNSFIKGIVGWVDLKAANINDRLSYYKQFDVVKGFRHVLQAEEPSLMLTSDFLKGISALGKFNYTYDILVFPKHLNATVELVRRFPDQFFVIDHIAKPNIKKGLIDQWRNDISIIAQYQNVYCKISGMITEADYKLWTKADLKPYIDIIVSAFGTKRIMFGSDWPVCLVAGTYEMMLSVVKEYFSFFTIAEQEDVFVNNCCNFYQL